LITTSGGSVFGSCSIRLATSPMPSQMTKNPGRHRHALAGVDQDAIAACQQRLHRIAVDG
jgi:hypothetical protein